MQIRRILLILAMLPALLLPGGSTYCLCQCAEMQAPETEHSCCAEVAAATDSHGRSAPVADMPCSGCHPLSLPDEQVQQAETKRAEAVAPPVLFVATTPVLAVLTQGRESTLRWAGCRAPSPPGRHRTLPLLI